MSGSRYGVPRRMGAKKPEDGQKTIPPEAALRGIVMSDGKYVVCGYGSWRCWRLLSRFVAFDLGLDLQQVLLKAADFFGVLLRVF